MFCGEGGGGSLSFLSQQKTLRTHLLSFRDVLLGSEAAPLRLLGQPRLQGYRLFRPRRAY